MLSDSVRQRLETLRLGQPVLAPIAHRAGRPRPAPPVPQSGCDSEPVVAAPADWFESGETVCNGSGEHYLIRIPVDRFWRGARRQPDAAQQAQDGRHNAAHEIELQALAASLPDRALLLDLETCGFAGSAIFLVGLLRQIDRSLCVELLLARNYAEERAVLESFWSRVGVDQVLVTFNGKSFDWPMIRDRSIRHHLTRELPRLVTTDGAADDARQTLAERRPAGRAARCDPWPQLVHCDLLHHARRRWRDSLPNCKLQTLERSICGRYRQGDIPGAQIPDAYHRFVRTGQRGQIRSILHHNAVDLITLLDLAQRLTRTPLPKAS